MGVITGQPEIAASSRYPPGQGNVDVCVVIPTFNEVDCIGAVIAELRGAGVDRVIVADGGSTDGTAAKAQAAGAEVVAAGRGYGRACLAGTQAASSDIIIFMDGDGADDPAAIPAMVAALSGGIYDFVIASRTRGRREPRSMAWHQTFAGHVAGFLTGVLYGVSYSDMCAFRAIRRDTLLALRMQEMTYGWNLEMQMRVARSGLRVLEIPVRYRRRLGGDSKVAGSLSGSLRAGVRIVATFARVALEPLRRTIKPETRKP
jgi:glycosyltransferase involved in cell wall biosynthesis